MEIGTVTDLSGKGGGGKLLTWGGGGGGGLGNKGGGEQCGGEQGREGSSWRSSGREREGGGK